MFLLFKNYFLAVKILKLFFKIYMFYWFVVNTKIAIPNPKSQKLSTHRLKTTQFKAKGYEFAMSHSSAETHKKWKADMGKKIGRWCTLDGNWE
jgi:hypothetical protein